MIKNIKDVKNVVVFSGTSDSVDIIKMLSKKGFNVIASVATEEGAKMLSSVKNITVSEGRLDTDDMIKLFDKYNADIVVDGSHPYAENVSKAAICACKIYNIPYVRYERPSSFGIENCVFVDDYESAVDYIENISGNILITTGILKYCAAFILSSTPPIFPLSLVTTALILYFFITFTLSSKVYIPLPLSILNSSRPIFLAFSKDFSLLRTLTKIRFLKSFSFVYFSILLTPVVISILPLIFSI